MRSIARVVPSLYLFLTAAPVQPGRQGLPVTGPDSISAPSYSLPWVYVLLFIVGVLSSWWCSSTLLRNGISVRRCRTQSLGSQCVSTLFLFLFQALLVIAILLHSTATLWIEGILSRQVTVTDVERPSLPQSVSRGVLRIVPDNPVKFLQAVWMPRPQPMLAGTHWSFLRSFHFSSPTPHTTLVISGCRFTSHLMVQERCVLAPCPVGR